MAIIIDFKPKDNLEAAEQLNIFVAWAQATLPKGIPHRVHECIRWEVDSWSSSGITGATFTALNSPRNSSAKTKLLMQPPFSNFAKAIAVYRALYLQKKSVQDAISSLRALEAALVELTRSRDVTQLTPLVCNRACELMERLWSGGGNAYNRSKALEAIIELMNEKGLLAKPFRWKSPVKSITRKTLKQQKEDGQRKLPSRESLKALGELFNNELVSPLDIVVTSACALLLSQPARIGELADVEHDCILFKQSVSGGERMFLRWYAEKGFGATTKPVVTGMESVVSRVVNRLLPITGEARRYAAWLEDNPDEFPLHDGKPEKALDTPLTYSEVCSALKISVRTGWTYRGEVKKFVSGLAKRKILSPAANQILKEINDGWDSSGGKRLYVKGKGGVRAYEFDDKAAITLRKLNILVREKYLPKYFPYTQPPAYGKKRVKFRDALFTVRSGALEKEDKLGRTLDFGVEIAADSARVIAQLGGSYNNIFDRHGYEGIRVNTHAFRHELNTEMHRAGLSQLLIDAFSGRTSMGSVYNHETVEERTQAVASVHPKIKQTTSGARLEKIRTNAPLKLSDVKDLTENDQDRVVHQTHLGICIHDFSSEPCPKMGSCLTCGKLGCVKGDEVKLKNLKEERDYLLERKSAAISAQSRGIIGAMAWVKKVRQDLCKCYALIKLLENPELENGDIVWNSDNGWSLTKNAAGMAGLYDPQIAEVNLGEHALPSLGDLSAMLDGIEA